MKNLYEKLKKEGFLQYPISAPEACSAPRNYPPLEDRESDSATFCNYGANYSFSGTGNFRGILWCRIWREMRLAATFSLPAARASTICEPRVYVSMFGP